MVLGIWTSLLVMLLEISKMCHDKECWKIHFILCQGRIYWFSPKYKYNKIYYVKKYIIYLLNYVFWPIKFYCLLTHWGRVTQICVFYITTAQDGWRKSAFLTRACFPSTIHLTFRHRASCVLGQAFHYSPDNAFYIFNQQMYFIIWYLLDRASLI